MLKRSARLALLSVILISFVIPVAASEVMLKNGDRVSGRIVDETDDHVVIDTEYAGKITIARRHIDKIAGHIDAAAAKGPAPVEPSAPAPAARGEKPRQAAAPAALKPRARLSSRGFRALAEGWEGNANVGFSFTTGNSNNSTMTTGIRAVKSSGEDNLTLYARSLWNSNRGGGRTVTTQNAFWGGARYDRNLDRRLFGYVSYDFERDRPKGLNLRSVAGGGLGRHVLKNEVTELDLLLGGAWNRTWQTGDNTDTPEAVAGLGFKHRFHEKLRFQNSLTFYQNVTDRNEYRVIMDTTVSADVTKRVGVFITIGDRFNNDPLRSARRNDFLFTTGMKWNFGKKR